VKAFNLWPKAYHNFARIFSILHGSLISVVAHLCISTSVPHPQELSRGQQSILQIPSMCLIDANTSKQSGITETSKRTLGFLLIHSRLKKEGPVSSSIRIASCYSYHIAMVLQHCQYRLSTNCLQHCQYRLSTNCFQQVLSPDRFARAALPILGNEGEFNGSTLKRISDRTRCGCRKTTRDCVCISCLLKEQETVGATRGFLPSTVSLTISLGIGNTPPSRTFQRTIHSSPPTRFGSPRSAEEAPYLLLGSCSMAFLRSISARS
jgi:hypothetical protein